MIDTLCDQAKIEDIAIASLYYDFLSQQEQTITNVMGAILRQLVSWWGDIPIYLRQAFQEGKKEIGGRRLRLADLIRMLKIAIASLPQVFICIDALDECLPKHLPELLKSLRDIVRECPGTRIFLTGRPYVGEDIHKYFPKAAMIPVSPKSDDIKNYLEMRLDGDADPEAMSDDLRADIIRIILERISDMCVGPFRISSSNDVCLLVIVCRFLLISLNIDAILGEMTIRERRKKLEEMTRGNGLRDAYTTTLIRLKAQKGNKSILGLRVLMWVLYSERPLRAEELCHALGVEIGSPALDPENVPALRTLLSSCLGLVTVEASSSTVRLVHFTLREHLFSDPTLFRNPHSTMAEVCLTYLNFRSVCDLPPTLRSAPRTMPFLEYASCWWGEHTRMEMSENVQRLALRLLERFDRHVSAQLLLMHYNEDPFSDTYFTGVGGPTGFTGLHGLAYLGIVELVAAVLEKNEWDIKAIDCMGSTALTWAARRGREKIVKILLEQADINPDQADTEYDQTPLSCAAENGHEGVVRMLLEREDVNPNQAGTEYGQTPLSWAAERGHEGVVKILLEREGVNPDQADTKYGRTPLSWAAERGYEGVVKILLGREDTNPNQADTGYGQTPLSWAAENGHEGVVKILLEREDVNPELADRKYGRTPLSWAAENGHEGVVRILLQREGVNPNQICTKSGQTPLSFARSNGHDGVVEMLLERGSINSDAAARIGPTSILPSARYGVQCMVDMQFGGDDPNINVPDFNWEPTLPSVDHDERPKVLDLEDSVSKSAGSDLSSTEPSRLSPARPLKSWYSPRNTHTHPNTQSAPSFAIDRSFIIASLVCLLAFLLEVLPSLLDVLSPHK